MSTSSVGGFAVGEENAGIVVLRLMETIDPMVISQELPNFSSDEPHLYRWPICSLRVEENGKILGDLYSAYADADFARDVVQRRRKRAYFSTKRKLRTEEEKVTIRLKKKAEKKLLDANIKEDMLEGCGSFARKHFGSSMESLSPLTTSTRRSPTKVRSKDTTATRGLSSRGSQLFKLKLF
ncbi:hypothetical protein R1sor_017151 [Riccia sorocarpa]|uniref:Uncharacterized protein n=1 Tax=Riccia sorocarpa TaxID=122646 RepID=A0ABD3I7T5_9MARC